MTPLVVAKNNKKVIKFYSDSEFNKWYSSKSNGIKSWNIEYKKGLASLEDAEYEEIIKNPNVIKLVNDKDYKESLSDWFGKDSTPRKHRILKNN